MDTGPLPGARAAFARDPAAAAVIEDDAVSSWADFDARVERDAAGLRTENGGPVGILLTSGIRFLATFFAAAEAGRPACTLHPEWAKPELEAAITDAGVASLVTDRTAPTCPPARWPEEAVSEDPVFYVGFTSGTSGRPKPFARRWSSWASSFAPAAGLFSVGPGDVVFLPGALHHSHFLFGAIFALNRGAAVRLFGRYDPEALGADLLDTDRGVVYLVPTMVHDLAEAGTGPFDKVHSVVVSGARMEPRHWQAARRLFPRARVSEVYGASELSFVTVATDERDTGLGRAGRPFPGVEIQIRPFDTGTDGEQLNAAESEPGLVFARSPYLFDGYLENSEITSPVGGDGFMTVGDVGVLGLGGLSLTARASNLLITGGKNVYPEEVEAALSRHRSVSESVVVGLPHERWGEELAAFLVPGERGDAPDPVELRAYLAGEIARYKIPKRWFTVAAIPRTPAGKLDRSAERLFADGEEL